jgi:ElaB/YqjD/DUF883 family membrane-anchored ribosome-binding protein
VDNELEVIRHQMEEKRASLAEKLGALEDEVLDTVHQAKAAVTDTVHNVTEAVDTVKEKVEQTVESVKERLDFRDAIRQHPWTAVGVSFAAGFAGGMFLETPSSPQGSSRAAYPQTTSYSPESSRPPGNGATTSSSALTSSLGPAGAELLQSIKGMAIGTLFGVLNEVVGNVTPTSMKADLHGMFENLNARLGGTKLYDFGTSSGEKEPAPSDERMRGYVQ